ncbi:NAD(P)H-dependent oxidoreductase [Nonomuraea sp. K274]|uniref:NAD(P)H-dependent oxidoreductase n=1 Tax=Nonomuraea cypriaca TaxID=1187855 RepID=A0A931EZN5_9ACTN|nr:NAD(P)H-dependent oxidoreductase [Nonomuraea cypriaca]MBF8185393.1 NAD(P)H-dependent oxidoreductase [Nonomuraea cypriaca]
MRENSPAETHEQLRLAVIVGSVRKVGFGSSVASWFAGQAGERTDMTLDVVCLAEISLPLAMPDPSGPPAAEGDRALAELTPRLAVADAFVVITPEYNHSFPAVLKNAIDLHRKEWQAKPVGFVSYGGISGGLRAVEQLRLVFAELHAVTIRDTVSFHNAWNGPDDQAGCATAAKTLLDQLAWWAWALRKAKAVRPYGA